MLRLAYLTTEYPAISHSFVRRELREIERRGHSVLPISIRRPTHKPVDPEDIAESARTVVCLDQPLWRFAAAMAHAALTRPLALLGAAAMAIRMGRQAGGTGLRSLVYLVEAAMLLRVLQSANVQHVHVHFGHNAATVSRLIRRLGGPTFSFTAHGIETFDAPRQNCIDGKVADALFAVGISDYGAAQLRRWSRYEDWTKIHVVRCAVDERFLDAAAPVDPESRTIVCVGRLSREKAQPLLIDAFAALVASDVDARLVLVGDGDLRQAIEAKVRDAGLGSRVELAGWATEQQVRAQITRCRALVLPSFMEGLPVVLLEAMAMGRPVIATRLTGIPELVRPSENGWLVTPGRVDELTVAMREVMLASADRLTAMGQAGRRLVVGQHSPVEEGDRLEALFLRHLNPAPRAAATAASDGEPACTAPQDGLRGYDPARSSR